MRGGGWMIVVGLAGFAISSLWAWRFSGSWVAPAGACPIAATAGLLAGWVAGREPQ